MKDIYLLSAETIGWLGQSTDESNVAMDLSPGRRPSRAIYWACNAEGGGAAGHLVGRGRPEFRYSQSRRPIGSADAKGRRQSYIIAGGSAGTPGAAGHDATLHVAVFYKRLDLARDCYPSKAEVLMGK